MNIKKYDQIILTFFCLSTLPIWIIILMASSRGYQDWFNSTAGLSLALWLLL